MDLSSVKGIGAPALSQGTRRLAAIMFTDMVGYTALGQKNEPLSLALIEEQRKLIRPIILRHNGREIKAMGDSFLVEFPNALDSVRCAYDIQRSTREYNISLPEDERINLRVGLHLGDVVESEGDVFGDAVNVASRIEPLAEDGGVCLTRHVYESTHNKFEVSSVSLGMKTLKNVSEPMEVYRMELPWAKTSVETASSPVSRIAILPFANMSPDPGDEYFADGMTDEIISTLSRLDHVEVISRTSIMHYKKNPKPIRDISRELNASVVLEGSVRKAGNRLRITTQLIDAAKDRHIWAEIYERNLEDVFAVQSEVAQRVADALKVRLHKAEHGAPTADIGAYTMYLRAMQLSHAHTEASSREAIALLEGAISKDSGFARAYAALADIWISMNPWEEFTTCVNRAEAAARKGVELGPASAETHTAMASVLEGMDRFDEALLESERAIRVNPNLVGVNRELGWEYAVLGRFDEAISHLKRAQTLDPLDPGPALILIPVLRLTGKVDDALAEVERLKEVHGRLLMAYHLEIMCHLQKRDFAKALRAVESGLRIDPDDHWVRIGRGMANAMSGEREKAMDELRDLMKEEAESHRLDARVWIMTQLGDIDGAFGALMRQAELHSWWGLIRFDPLFERLQKYPRFPEFSKKVGFPT
jgi:adenylate cyclase